ncbi:diguanylate cyclase [Ancylobacter sp. A5.8]|uniref:diguanylate cyclase n=1 Tax=Ancylobacter gelatini TaxID=2919920 RepID=UPI001F4EC652|nr:diguanylate cyclase [Ancylobacter gelatini]MCJ8141851.1 diguanylate cyclase [Ancylobacter gelatini]
MSNEAGATPLDVTGASDKFQARVLLVDDQVLICEAVRRALFDETDIEFHYCTNPLEAITIAEGFRPTVILQDLVMPGVDGLDLVARYRERPSIAAVPVIVLSARDEAVTKSAAFKAGANDYLVKLPDRVELIARLRYHSRAYIDHVERDAAYAALRESQRLLMQANLELERLTRVDGLTGLGNRRYFDEYMQAEWRRAQRSGGSVALLMIDVDRFKLYNDTYGHLAGDDVLRKIGGTLQGGASRPGDLAVRFGGEEFVVVLLGTTIVGASTVAQRLVQSVRDLAIPHGEGTVTVSIGGAAACPTDDMVPDLLIRAADLALYRAKNSGRDRVELSRSG